MKVLKQILFGLLVLANCLVFGQDSLAKKTKLYNKGVEMYNKHQFKKAESFLTSSLNVIAFDKNFKDSAYNLTSNSFYYLALTQLQLKDTCAACKNIKISAYAYVNLKTQQLNYDCLCKKKKKINYNNCLGPETNCYVEFTEGICEDTKEYPLYLIENLKNDGGCLFRIIDPDSIKKFDPYTQFPDIKTIPSDKIVFIIADTLPEFPGGDTERIKFLTDNIKYPQSAKEQGTTIKVYVTFIVEADGSVSNVNILRGIGDGFDEEAIRVTKLMKWKPAKCCGIPVRMQFNMPVTFSL